MLPGADRGGVPHRHPAPLCEVTDEIGDDPVLGPVAAADHVPGPHGGHLHAMIPEPFRGEIARSECGGDDLGGGLAGAVGIAATQRVVLDVGTTVVVGQVALVARDHDHGAGPAGTADRVEQGGGAGDVRRYGVDRIAVAAADDRLCGQVDDDVGRGRSDLRLEPGRVPHVGLDVPLEECGDPRRGEQ